jgi:ABC-2 type transport system ATP-binding protein
VGNNGAGKTTFFSLYWFNSAFNSILLTTIYRHQRKLETFTASFIDESFLIGYLTQKNISISLAICGQNKPILMLC